MGYAAFLKTLEFFELSSPHSTVLLTPTVKGLFRDLNFPDRINACQPLAYGPNDDAKELQRERFGLDGPPPGVTVLLVNTGVNRANK